MVRHACLCRRPKADGEVAQVARQAARAIHRGDDDALRREPARWPALASLCDDSPGALRITNRAALHKLLGAAITDPAALTPTRRPGTADGPQRRVTTDSGHRMSKTAASNVLLRPVVRR